MSNESIGTGTKLDGVEKVTACGNEHDSVSVYTRGDGDAALQRGLHGGGGVLYAVVGVCVTLCAVAILRVKGVR